MHEQYELTTAVLMMNAFMHLKNGFSLFYTNKNFENGKKANNL